MKEPVNTARVAGETFRARNTIPYALAVAAVGLFSFLSGGYVIGRSTPVAVAFLCAAAAWVWFLRRSSRPSVLFLAAVGAFTAFTVWSGLSVLWSYGPDLTWVAFNLTAFYLAAVTVLGLTSARGLQLRVVGYGVLVVAAAVGIYAFLGKGLPDVVTHAHAFARIDSPVGYWNVLALMMVIGLCAALAVAGDRSTRVWLRSAAAAAAVPMCLAFFFTFSRGGWLVLGLALVLYFAFTTTRLGSVVSLAAIVAPVALVLLRLRDLETLFVATTDGALRTLQGHTMLRWAVAAVLVTVAVQTIAAWVQGSVRWPRWSTVAAGATLLVVAGVVVFGGSGLFLQRHGGVQWVRDKGHALVTDAESESDVNAAGRLFTVTSNGRIPLWREAGRQSRIVRVAGSGAGTFAFSHYRFRDNGGVVKHAHSQWFNVLSELGIVGLVLLAAALVLFVVAAVGNPFARRGDPLHPLLVALQVGAVAFFVHMSWDWDWDMAAAGMLAFALIAVTVSYRGTRAADDRRAARLATLAVERGEEADGEVADARGIEAAAPRAEADEAPALPVDAEEEQGHVEEVAGAAATGHPGHDRARRLRMGWSIRVIASAALLLLAACWLPPYLAQRAENAALADASDGRVEPGLEHARRAARLDPLAVGPLLTEATLLQQLGQNRAALVKLEAAARLQPQNFEVWYALGELQQGALGRVKDARTSFTRALALNPLDAASRYELERLVHSARQ
jgi:hypothetical protein